MSVGMARGYPIYIYNAAKSLQMMYICAKATAINTAYALFFAMQFFLGWILMSNSKRISSDYNLYPTI